MKYILTDKQVEMIEKELKFVPQKAENSTIEIIKEQFGLALVQFIDGYSDEFKESTIQYIKSNEEEIQTALEPSLSPMANDVKFTIKAIRLNTMMLLRNIAKKQELM